jgi:hypothetical protein
MTQQAVETSVPKVRLSGRCSVETFGTFPGSAYLFSSSILKMSEMQGSPSVVLQISPVTVMRLSM